MLLRMGFPLLMAMLFLAACGGGGGGSDGGGEEDATFSITTSSLGSAIEGAPYNAAIATSHGSENGYQWSISAGSLPPGLSLTGGTPNATLAGTPTSTGTYDFTVQADDPAGSTDTQPLTLTIDPPPPPLSITTSSLPNGDENVAYTETIAATGGTGTGYTWSLTSGSLPAGLGLTGGTPDASISGTPTTAGTYDFTARVEDSMGNSASRVFTVNILSPTPLTITSSALPDGSVGVSYNEVISASGGTTQGYQWSVVSGTLPPGLSLTGGSPATSVSGTPTTQGNYTFTVEVIDSASNTATGQIMMDVFTPGPLGISTTSLADGMTGTTYSENIEGVGGTRPYTWSLESGTLPHGVSLIQGEPNASLTGMPYTSMTFNFTLRLEDATSASVTTSLSVFVGAGPLSITTTSLDYAVVNSTYGFTIHTKGGSGIGSWSVSSGMLPSGLTLAGGNHRATIYGKPTQSGTFNFTIEFSDPSSNSAQQSYTMDVHGAGGQLVIATQGFELMTTHMSHYWNLNAVGGSGSGYVFGLAAGSTLPPGLTLSSTNSRITGQPTQAGTFTFTLEVTDSASNMAQRNYTVNVSELIVSPGASLIRKKTVFMVEATSSMDGQRLAVVRAELVARINDMDASYEFDCVAFSSLFPSGSANSIFLWGETKPATSANKAAAIDWIDNSGVLTYSSGLAATYPCMQELATTYSADLEMVFVYTDGMPAHGGTSQQLLDDAPMWWLKFADCRLVVPEYWTDSFTHEYFLTLGYTLGNEYGS